MDKLLTITKDEHYVFFNFTHIDIGRTETLSKIYFPDIEENFKSMFEKTDGVKVVNEVFTLEDILKSQIDLFIDYCKNGGHRLNIIFDNCDTTLSVYLKKNYKNYLVSRLNYFKQVVYGITVTPKVQESFYEQSIAKGVTRNLMLSNYLILEGKSL